MADEGKVALKRGDLGSNPWLGSFSAGNVVGGRVPGGVSALGLGRPGRHAHDRQCEREFAGRLREVDALLASRGGKRRRYARERGRCRASHIRVCRNRLPLNGHTEVSTAPALVF